MTTPQGEGVPVLELGDQDRFDMVGQFEAANMLTDKTERNRLGRQLMGIVFDRIGRSDLAEVEEPYLETEVDGTQHEVQMQDGSSAKYLDYLAVATDLKHGPAAKILTNFVKVHAFAPGVNEKYDGYVAGVTELLEKHLPDHLKQRRQ